MAFYVLKEYYYAGFCFYTFQNEKEAVDKFISRTRNANLVTEKYTLYKYEYVSTTTLPPIFLPTHRYMYNHRTGQYEFVKFKKSYKRIIKNFYRTDVIGSIGDEDMLNDKEE